MKSENGPSTWKCSQCEKEFKYESEKRRHVQSHVPQFECKVCFKKFSFLSALRRHEKQHERNGSVKCSECERKFRDESLLKRHIQYAHKGTYTCTSCKSTYHSEIALRTHMKTHKPESEWKFQCSFNGCNKKFNFAHHLKHHELTHTNIKPHVCKECGKRFIQFHHLKVHQRLHKPDSWLYCTEKDCEKKFTNEYALRRHIATHKKKLTRSDNISKADVSPLCKMEAEELMINFLSEGQAKNRAIPIIICSQKGRILAVEPLVQNSLNELKAANINIAEDFTGPNTGEIDKVNFKKVLENITYETDSKVVIDVDKTNIQLLEATETEDKDSFISNCQSVLGKCIVTGESEANENCLCAQMDASALVEKISTLGLPKNNNSTRSVKLSDDLTCIEKRRKYANACETCECASTCDLKDKAVRNESPEIVYGNNGIVKIKDTFDIDLCIELPNDKDKKANNIKFDWNMESVAISSCKDVLGNCIVSGNGTMGDGCLCARMTAEDQQVIEQEMDEITPHPWSS